MELKNPLYLLLFIVIPLLIFWYELIGKKLEGTLRISSTSFISERLQRSGNKKALLIRITNILVLSLIIIALSRPRLVDELQQKKVEVIDMLLVLDISSSMLASDFKPNRLAVMKNTAADFIDLRGEDRIGIIVFAGESFIQCPLTVDKMVLKSLIKEITVATKEYDGTAIGMAIANGINRLRNSNVKSKVIVLLSDGSNNAGEIDPLTAAELANNFNIKIYTIGAGTNQSYSKIPGRGLIQNEIDEKTLQQIAKITGGKYFRATDELALKSIYSEIDLLERSEIQIKQYTRYKELYSWFLIPACFLSVFAEIFRRIIFKSKN